MFREVEWEQQYRQAGCWVTLVGQWDYSGQTLYEMDTCTTAAALSQLRICCVDA
jgi:hypothetical protein